MKKNGHPGYHKIVYITTTGERRECRSTMGVEGEVKEFQLDVDPFSHPAWTGGTGTVRATGQVQKFNDKWGNLGIKKTASAS